MTPDYWLSQKILPFRYRWRHLWSYHFDVTYLFGQNRSNLIMLSLYKQYGNYFAVLIAVTLCNLISMFPFFFYWDYNCHRTQLPLKINFTVFFQLQLLDHFFIQSDDWKIRRKSPDLRKRTHFFILFLRIFYPPPSEFLNNEKSFTLPRNCLFLNKWVKIKMCLFKQISGRQIVNNSVLWVVNQLILRTTALCDTWLCYLKLRY